MNNKPIIVEFENKPYVMKIVQLLAGAEKYKKTDKYRMIIPGGTAKGFIKETVERIIGQQYENFTYEVSFHEHASSEAKLLSEVFS